MTREQVWRVLVLLGVVKVEIAFSGGNDEGGPDNVSVYFADEDILELYEPDTGSTSPEAKLLERLIEPLYDRWGGFDGNFEVTGLYTWDVATQTVDADFSETEWVGHTESW